MTGPDIEQSTTQGVADTNTETIAAALKKNPSKKGTSISRGKVMIASFRPEGAVLRQRKGVLWLLLNFF